MVMMTEKFSTLYQNTNFCFKFAQLKNPHLQIRTL